MKEAFKNSWKMPICVMMSIRGLSGLQMIPRDSAAA
jgi:hypothetical protein